MGFGSSFKKTIKRVGKEIGRGVDRVSNQVVRSSADVANMFTQAATGGTVGVRDNFSFRSGDVIGRATQEVRDNWTKWRAPLLIGAGTALAATGIGAGIGALTIGAAAGATTGAISGTIAGGVGSTMTSFQQHEEREAEAEAAEYAQEVERQKQAFELATAIQSQSAMTVNPSAYYNIYSKYGRKGNR